MNLNLVSCIYYIMLSLYSPTATSYTRHKAPVSSPVTRHPSLIILVLILLDLVCIQSSQAQEVTDREISTLEQRLKIVETNLVSIIGEIQSLNEKFDTVTAEINRLKQELRDTEVKPKSFLSRIAGVFSQKQRKLEKLLTESQDLADRINALQKKQGALVSELVALSDKLVELASLRITDLMAAVRRANLSNNVTVRDEALKQVSALWQLAERTTATRNKYAPGTIGPERMIGTLAFPSLLSNDPEELRLGAAILKNYAAEERSKAAQLQREIEKLQMRKSLLKQMMELSKEIQRSDEEKGAVGVGIGVTHIPWGNEATTKREIEDIDEKIVEKSAKKREYEAKAERFESQSETLEQRASQIQALEKLEQKGTRGVRP